MKKETKLWMQKAQDDFDMMHLAWEHRKYDHTVLFGQQAAEKIIKAYIVEILEIAPRKVHFIEDLIKQAKLDIKEIGSPDVRQLSFGFTRVRYPDMSKKYYESRKEVTILLVMSEKVYLWVLHKLQNS